jgi:hypothetical protein
MGTGYTRNDTSNNIADGNVINASDLDGEFDAVQAAFNGTTGHSHDGTSGEGPQIAAGGIANNAVALGTKTTGNYVATITAGTGISGSSSSEGGTPTIALATAGAGSGTYGSTSDGTKIDTITLDAYGRVTAVATGATGDIQGVTAGTNLTGGGTSGTVTINMATGGAGAATYGSTDDGTKIDTITLDAYGRVTAVATGATMDRWVLEDGDGTEVIITNDKEVKFVEGGGVDINWTDTSTGSDGDPYDLTFTINTSVTAGNGLTGGGQLNASRTINVGAGTGISVSADAVALATAGAGAGTYGSTSDGTKIDQITLDAYGRVTAVTTGSTGSTSNTGDITGVTAGSGLTGGGTSGTVTLNHEDTSSQASVNNSGTTFIQDVTLDTYGHVTGLTSATASGGKIAQVLQTSKTSTFSTTSTASAGVEITGLTRSITPSATSSKVLVTVSLGQTSNSNANWRTSAFILQRGTTAIGVGDASGSRIRTSFAADHQNNSSRGTNALAYTFLDSPNTTSSVTYSVHAVNETSTLYINRTTTDTNSTATTGQRTASQIQCMEVLA